MKSASGTRDLVVYGGRFADKVSEHLPSSKILDEWSVLPHRLAQSTGQASGLALLDPLSFPFEAMTDEQWDLPILVVPPPEFDADTLMTIFGPSLFSHLGPFDLIATADPKTWNSLRKRYSWAHSQYIRLDSKTTFGAAEEIRTLLENSPEDLRQKKQAHRIEAKALSLRIAELRYTRPNTTLRVLEIGTGDGHWPTSFDLSATDFSGVYTDHNKVEDARMNFPEYSFSLPQENFDLTHPNDTLDLSFSVNFMQVQPESVKASIISEMWRTTRPGGRMIFLEDFVTGGFSNNESHLSASDFFEFVFDAAGGRVVVDHVESLLYPDENMFRGGLISLRKLGNSDG